MPSGNQADVLKGPFGLYAAGRPSLHPRSPPEPGETASVSERPCPGKPLEKTMVPPLTPTLANDSLQNKADNCFSRLVFFFPALWLKDPARRGMILPLPRVHRTGLDDFHFKLRVDGAHQPPQTPKPHRHMRLTRISVFPGPPKQKDPKGFRVGGETRFKTHRRGRNAGLFWPILAKWPVLAVSKPPGGQNSEKCYGHYGHPLVW